MTSRTTVTSADGTRLAVFDHGATAPSADGKPTLVCVHGFPDDHTLWDDVVAELRDDFRVVTYDVRGIGGSDRPRGRAAYRLERLADDLSAVIDAVGAGEKVHVLGHDWGSIQAWHHVTSDQAPSRVASYTSISGPDLDLAGRWIRSRSRGTLQQVAHSWYIFFFQLPVVPEATIRTGLLGRSLRRIVGEGAPVSVGGHDEQRGGLALYRANMVQRILLSPRHRSTEVPVLVLVAEDDDIVGRDVQVGSARLGAVNLRVRSIPGSHWVPRSHPAAIARELRAFVAAVPSGSVG